MSAQLKSTRPKLWHVQTNTQYGAECHTKREANIFASACREAATPLGINYVSLEHQGDRYKTNIEWSRCKNDGSRVYPSARAAVRDICGCIGNGTPVKKGWHVTVHHE